MAEHTARAVIITGGTGGLGSAVVRRLIGEYTCIVLYRSADAWQRLQQELGSPAQLHGIEADLQDHAAVEQAVQQAHTKIGALYGLVHLVGGFEMGSVAETTPERWQAMIDTNLNSTFAVAHAVVPRLQAAGSGRIITIGSSSVPNRPAGMAAYTVSKAALNALTDVLAKELKDTRITANTILAGSLATPAMRGQTGADKLVPLERVADTIAFLLSDAAASITGASIPVTVTGGA